MQAADLRHAQQTVICPPPRLASRPTFDPSLSHRCRRSFFLLALLLLARL
jgi:hypothetical protein